MVLVELAFVFLLMFSNPSQCFIIMQLLQKSTIKYIMRIAQSTACINSLKIVFATGLYEMTDCAPPSSMISPSANRVLRHVHENVEFPLSNDYENEASGPQLYENNV